MLSIIFGGQFGSEGKGKVTKFWAERKNARAVIRVGGPNSGHTVYQDGKKHVLRQLPVSIIDKRMFSILPAGSYLNLDILLREIRKYEPEPKDLWIDENAVIITAGHILSEEHFRMDETIGSTLSGTGYALRNRIMREEHVRFAKDVPELKPFICPTKNVMRELLNQGEHLVIEGTQGAGLSNLHTPYYPYATARDTNAAGFLSECGLSPFDVEHVVMVIRTYPIRVGGNSGPLPNEITWEELTRRSGSENLIQEYTSATNRLRRVAKFDPDVVKMAILNNKPDIIVLNHVDYFDKTNPFKSLSEKQKLGIYRIQDQINQNINYIGTSPEIIQKF